MSPSAAPAGPVVRTVLGDLAPGLLGATNYHEHLFQETPLLPGDELDDESASAREASLLRQSGFAAMVDATPFGLGRCPSGLARISAATGLRVVATTGRHREAHYAHDHPTRGWDADALAALCISDLTTGMPEDDADPLGPPAAAPGGAPVLAGILKGGVDYWSISEFEQVTLEAIAAAHAATGAPIMIHLEFCTAAHEVLDLLEREGVPAQRVVLAHADRDPDPLLHAALAERGAYLGYDGAARPRSRSDAELVALTARLVEAGHAERILLGGDVARRSRYVSYGGMPGLGYLGERYLPRLRAAVGNAAVNTMVCENPARLLTIQQ